MRYYLDAHSTIEGQVFWRNWMVSGENLDIRGAFFSQQFPATVFRLRRDGVVYGYLLGGSAEPVCNLPVVLLEFHVKNAQDENVTIFVADAQEFRAWLFTKLGVETFTLQGDNPS